MKKLIYITFFALILTGCKKDKKEIPELSVAEKIANAHGFEQWKHVKDISFTFNGKRSWKWQPKTNTVTLFRDSTNITYNRTAIDSVHQRVDKGFINDKFWLLIPFQLVWDSGLTISETEIAKAPVSQKEMNKITMLYSNEVGYTPGDAYDIYYDNDFIIREWAFRRGNKQEPNLVNTFENYQDFNGLKLALDHKKPDDKWSVKFTNVTVNLEN